MTRPIAFTIAITATLLAAPAGAADIKVISAGAVRGLIGGMIAASAIAIFLIPVTFYVIERFAAGRKEKSASSKITKPQVEPEPAVNV